RLPRAPGTGLASLSSVPLGPNRSVHLVRAGRDFVLLGVAEQGVVPIRAYSEEEALQAGLVDGDGLAMLPAGDAPPKPRLRLQLPRVTLPTRPRAALPAPR